jgi:hypothetical protein
MTGLNLKPSILILFAVTKVIQSFHTFQIN